MGETIQVRRGPHSRLPELANGEIALTTDTKDIYIGTPEGNELIGGQTITSSLAEMTTVIKPSANDSQNINALIANGGSFLVKKGVYNITDNVNVKSNTTITFEKGAIFQKTPTSSDTYFVINIDSVDNVEIINPQIIGDRSSHIGTTGEWGHGINIVNSEKITIVDPDIKDCWGDGIYIGIYYRGVNLKRTDHIYIIRPKIDNVRRNGISVCSGGIIEIVDPYITNVNGTAPEAGIDIEPESLDNSPYLDNLRITNPITKNCTAGIMYLLVNLIGKSTDIQITNHVDDGSTNGLVGFAIDGDVKGKMDVKTPYYKNNYQHGVIIYDNHATSLKISLIEPHIENCNVANSTDVTVGSPIFLYADSSLTNAKAMGNVDIINPRFTDTRTTPQMLVPILAYSLKPNNNTLDKINVVDIKEINYPKNYLQVIGNFACTDRYKQLEISNTTNPIDVSVQSFRKRYDNKGATIGINYTLNADCPIGSEITFDVLASQQLAIVPNGTTAILPIASVGKYIISSTIGNSVSLKKISATQWVITNMVGTWTVQP